MHKLWTNAFSLLEPQERLQAFGLLCLIVLMAFVEVLGIASIIPFMAVLSEPPIVETNKWLKWGYERFEFTSINNYLFALGLIVLMFLIFSNALKGFTRWATLNFSQMRGHGISRRLFTLYLNQPYDFFLERNSSELSKNILAEVYELTNNILVPCMDLAARLMVMVSVILLLCVIDPVLAISAAFVLGGLYGFIFWALRGYLAKLGQRRVKAQAARYKIVGEAFQGIKNLKLTGHEQTYQGLFEKPSATYSSSSALSATIAEMPRYALEVIAFGGILLIVLYMLMNEVPLDQSLPLITLYAFAGYRLMPNLQAGFQSLAKMKFYNAALTNVLSELKLTSQTVQPSKNADIPALPFKNAIEVRDLSFSYAGSTQYVLHNLNLTIPANSTTGIVGKTGSGKTTFVDILLGLLRPSRGAVYVDGTGLTQDNLAAWQKNLAYVAQHIYLSDDTVRRNIAFGMRDEDIDEAQVRRAAQMACIDTFIETELGNGYDTIVGENGIRLSGGQRQRLGLARALYLDRSVLVLDEATSALDTETEESVMEAITALKHQKTIILIAHRLSTLENCDQVIDLGKE